jgi:uncharacterized iron-regulated protein
MKRRRTGQLGLAATLLTAVCAQCTHASTVDQAITPNATTAASPRQNAATLITDLRQLLPALAAADFVLVGERHDHPPQHRIQAEILSLWLSTGRRPAVAFEQLDTGQQPALDRFLAGTPHDATDLGKSVGWDKSGWPPWPMYQPIADVAVRARLPLVAALLPRAATMQIATAGLGAAFTVAEQHRLGLDQPEAPAIEAALTVAIAEGHCNLLPPEALPPMVTVQKARDAGMAERLAAAGANGHGALLITGNQHARRDLGVPRYLARLVRGAHILSIALVERGISVPGDDLVGGSPANDGARSTLSGSGSAYDAVYVTERLPEPDHCAELKKKFHKH